MHDHRRAGHDAEPVVVGILFVEPLWAADRLWRKAFLLAGQAAGLSRSLPAAELLETLASETQTVIRSL